MVLALTVSGGTSDEEAFTSTTTTGTNTVTATFPVEEWSLRTTSRFQQDHPSIALHYQLVALDEAVAPAASPPEQEEEPAPAVPEAEPAARAPAGAAPVETVVKPAAPAPTEAPVERWTVTSAGAIQGQATHYGASYAGRPMGCGGIYDPANQTIVAVGPARYSEWPCGAALQVCGAGGCIVVTRQDACPGCHANVIDLSESGNSLVCGGAPHTCRVTIQPLR